MNHLSDTPSTHLAQEQALRAVLKSFNDFRQVVEDLELVMSSAEKQELFDQGRKIEAELEKLSGVSVQQLEQEQQEGDDLDDLLSEYRADMAQGQEMNWPKARDLARLEDMSPNGHLRLTLDGDNDICVEVFDPRHECFCAVEFCAPGAGGGKSSHTRKALIEVMAAMERDNAESPFRTHPRFGGPQSAIDAIER